MNLSRARELVSELHSNNFEAYTSRLHGEHK